jgi:hypothetical protein
MQTKKRAKSVSFGKSKKEESQKETPSIDEQAKHIVASVEQREANDAKEERLEEKKESLTDEAETPKEDKEEEHTAVEEEKKEQEEDAPKKEDDEKADVTEEKEIKDTEEKDKEEKESITDFAPSHPTDESKDSLQESGESKEKEGAGLPASSFFSETSFADDRRSRKKKGHLFFFFVVALISFILGLGIMAGISYGLKNNYVNVTKDWLGSLQPSPTPTAQPQPSPTPKEEKVDLSAYTLAVLNGSGITGEASKLKTKLVTAGFKVGSTANADTEDYTKTQIKVKKNVNEAYIKKLKAELEKSYKVQESSQALTSGDSDVVVTIGSETAK